MFYPCCIISLHIMPLVFRGIINYIWRQDIVKVDVFLLMRRADMLFANNFHGVYLQNTRFLSIIIN